MSRALYHKITPEKLEAYLDGRLNEQETAEVDALIDSDAELKLIVDDYINTQLSIINDRRRCEGSGDSVDLEAIAAMNSVIASLDQPAIKTAMVDVKERRKPLPWIVSVACGIILIIVGALVLVPTTYEPRAPREVLSRGNDAVFGPEIDYEAQLATTEETIDELEKELPRFAFFERFKSDAERAKFDTIRSEVYELKWTRIDCLKKLERDAELRNALEEYAEIEGYHQQEAREMLDQL